MGCNINVTPKILKLEYDDEPYGAALREIQSFVDNADLLVCFNAKFDIHWIRRYGIRLHDRLRVWDVQLAYFIMGGQTEPYPSLDDVCKSFGLPIKPDVVRTEYWDKGIDTPDIPYDILSDYLTHDIAVTRQLYDLQMEALKDKPKLYNCIRMACMDLIVLEEMEYNGIILDLDECKNRSREATEALAGIDSQLNVLSGATCINWRSTYHVSSVLYGGTITYSVPTLVENVLKSGKTSSRIRNVEHQQVFGRLVEPLPDTALDKEGYWSVSADTLRELKCTGKAKQIVELILQRHELAKLNDTYYKGLPKMIEEMEWENNTIHGNLNQCVAVTGRLSSTKPNMQNNPPQVDLLFRSRYNDTR